MALLRLSANWDCQKPASSLVDNQSTSQLANIYGTTKEPLWNVTLGTLIDTQAKQYGSKPAAVFPWQCHTLSYNQLAQRSKVLSSALLEAGLKHGDCIGIMAGNCYQYIEVFLGGARIGCPVVVLNNTYTPIELKNALIQSDCRVLFVSSQIAARSLKKHTSLIYNSRLELPSLCRIVYLTEDVGANPKIDSQTYTSFMSNISVLSGANPELKEAEAKVLAKDVLNLQFTSGTTGSPKAAMLTHNNIINNGRFIGAAMRLTADDVVCCPPPLFHCFGLVIGFLASFSCGSSIVYPSEQFDANLTLDAVKAESATVLLGVPTMFVALLEANEKRKLVIDTLRIGLAAGAAVPVALMNQLRDEFGIGDMMIAYGMTETSPVSFISSLDDPQEKRASTLGRVMPHTGAKIISKDGKGTILGRGESGELCVSGYALQKGYWKNATKTNETMLTDAQGTVWMHTGDECKIDEDGYCWITGRIKDMIIRGGENIYPIEIEERLLAHSAISEASVVGLKDDRYGEVVASFLRLSKHSEKPDDENVRDWVRSSLARHKAPKFVFWVGETEIIRDYPKTGSGKHQKHLLRDIGQKLLQTKPQRAKL